MSDGVVRVQRPQRWDQPYGTNMQPAQVNDLLKRPEFANIDTSRFPESMPLRGILQNDCRIRRCRPGDLLIREGDYGNSAFLVLDGRLRVVVKPGLPEDLLGRGELRKKGIFKLIDQALRIPAIPEMQRQRQTWSQGRPSEFVNLYEMPGVDRVFSRDEDDHMQIHSRFDTAVMESGDIVGEIAALGRIKRTATLYAETEATLLEIRWQGLREIRRYDPKWRQFIDDRYRQNLLYTKLAALPMFSQLSNEALKQVANNTLFETYGSFEWSQAFKNLDEPDRQRVGSQLEPIVVGEGEYADGLLLIGAGFARVSVRKGNGHRTLAHLAAGDLFGLHELHQGWKQKQDQPLKSTLSALGYLHVLRIPASVLHELVFPQLQDLPPDPSQAHRPQAVDALLDWAVSERFINGTQTMLIDMDRCVRCDDCVRACAATHDGNPRFVRHGQQHAHWMVANACMHCNDPVCMIGCPTGAIHRIVQGVVVINNDTCIGCGTCANSCPYDNIRMVELHDKRGLRLTDPENQTPIMRATKCDLCASQPGGPACVRACPHDALRRIDFRDNELLNLEREL